MGEGGPAEHDGGGQALLGGVTPLQEPLHWMVPEPTMPQPFATDEHGVFQFAAQTVTAHAPDLALLSVTVMVLAPAVA